MGVDALNLARYNQSGSIPFFRQLQSQSARRDGSQERFRVLSTHPPASRRIEYLESLWRNSPRKSGFEPLPWEKTLHN